MLSFLNNKKSENIFKSIFLKVNHPLFLVDDDMVIHKFNIMGKKLIPGNKKKKNILNKRLGDLLHCFHSFESLDGCGRSEACKDCIIRNSTKKALQGEETHKRRLKTHFALNGKKKEVELLISTTLIDKESKIFLLEIEDITELTALNNIISICCSCKKINNDDTKSWEDADEYFKHFIGVNFSHGLCPECAQEVYKDMQE